MDIEKFDCFLPSSKCTPYVLSCVSRALSQGLFLGDRVPHISFCRTFMKTISLRVESSCARVVGS